MNTRGRFALGFEVAGFGVVDLLAVVLVVSAILFRLRDTRITKFIPVLLFLGVIKVASSLLSFELLGTLSSVLLVILPVVIAILLRDELYEAFITQKERVKRSKEGGTQENLSEEVLAGFSKGVIKSANNNVGVLAVFNKGVDLTQYTETGLDIGAFQVSESSIYTLFATDSDLNSGAVVIEDEFFTHANVRLPKTNNPKAVDTYYDNNRHLAAFGLLEREDVVIVLVSAETGYIRVFYRGKDGKLNVDSLTTLENNVSGIMSVGYLELKRLLQRMLNIKVEKPTVKKGKDSKGKKGKDAKEKETKEEKQARREREREERRAKKSKK